MQSIKNILLLIVGISMSSMFQAQELSFTIISATTYDETIDLGIASSFTKQSTDLTWTQEVSGQTHTTLLEIISSEGSWNVESSQGILMYYLMQEDSGITLTITGDSEGITAVLTMPSNTTESETLEYTFSNCSISYL